LLSKGDILNEEKTLIRNTYFLYLVPVFTVKFIFYPIFPEKRIRILLTQFPVKRRPWIKEKTVERLLPISNPLWRKPSKCTGQKSPFQSRILPDKVLGGYRVVPALQAA
jgi:hypothetical protein